MRWAEVLDLTTQVYQLDGVHDVYTQHRIVMCIVFAQRVADVQYYKNKVISEVVPVLIASASTTGVYGELISNSRSINH